MSHRRLILVMLLLLPVGVLAGWLIGSLNSPDSAGVGGDVGSVEAEPRVRVLSPREDKPWPRMMPASGRAEGISDEEFAAKLEQVRQQMGAGFRVALAKPFVVTSNQSAQAFEQSCGQTIRWAVEMLNKDFFSKGPDEIITVYLFDGKESYEKYTMSLFQERPTTPYGYYSPEHGALVMNIATGGGTLVHEIVHPLLAADFPSAPSWFDEGLASLYEQSRQRDGQITGMLNWRLPVLQKGMRAGHFVALEKLLATNSDDFYDDYFGMHYAQVRYLCYYLQEKGLLRKFYREFRENHGADPTGVKTLLRVTGKDSMKELEREWLEFLAPLTYR